MSKTVEPVVLSPDVQPVHYKLEITPDLDRLEFLGNEKIDVVVSASTKSVTLHCKEIDIQSVSFTSKDATSAPVAVEQIAYHLKDTTVTFIFDGELAVGEGVLDISFRGILNGDMAGFYKSSYSDVDGKKMTMASTQFEGKMN